MMKLFALAAAALAMSASVATAMPVDITGSATAATFKSFGTSGQPGVHGLETRGGNNATNGTWELGLGVQTSVSGQFAQAQLSWGPVNAPTLFNFEYDYGGTVSTFKIFNDSVSQTLSWGGSLNQPSLQNGNAVEVFAKRGTVINITEFDGNPFSQTIGDLTTTSFARTFFDTGFNDGFKLKGTVQVVGGGNSANGMIIKAGNVTPIPLPMGAWFALTGVAGAVALRRRKAQAA